MINLLPTTEKNSIRKEYRLRVIATILTGLLIISSIALILFIPPYILTLYKNRAAENIISKAPTSEGDQADFSERLTIAQDAVAILKPDTKTLLPTESIAFVMKHKTASIKITSLAYDKRNNEPEVIRVVGIAKTRQTLVEFTNALRSEARVASIDLPVSSFAQDTNISFEFNINTR